MPFNNPQGGTTSPNLQVRTLGTEQLSNSQKPFSRARITAHASYPEPTFSPPRVTGLVVVTQQDLLGNLLKIYLPGSPHPGILIQQVWGADREYACLTSTPDGSGAQQSLRRAPLETLCGGDPVTLVQTGASCRGLKRRSAKQMLALFLNIQTSVKFNQTESKRIHNRKET